MLLYCIKAWSFGKQIPTVTRNLHWTHIGPQFRCFGLDFDDVSDDPEVEKYHVRQQIVAEKMRNW